MRRILQSAVLVFVLMVTCVGCGAAKKLIVPKKPPTPVRQEVEATVSRISESKLYRGSLYTLTLQGSTNTAYVGEANRTCLDKSWDYSTDNQLLPVIKAGDRVRLGWAQIDGQRCICGIEILDQRSRDN